MLVFAAFAARGDFALQFRAKDITSGGSWPSFSGETRMSAVHSSNGWTHAAVSNHHKPHGSVSFEPTSQGAPSPFAFGSGETRSVSHAFIVVYSDSGQIPLSTLINAPSVPLRVKTVAVDALFGAPETASGFMTEFRGETNSVAVDNKTPPILAPSPAPRLVHCVWETPQELGRIFVGNSPASPFWRREWRGTGVAELILAGEIGERAVNAIKRYVSAAHGVGDIAHSDGQIPEILRALGLDNSVFATTVIVK